jgi:hypothetical protein
VSSIQQKLEEHLQKEGLGLPQAEVSKFGSKQVLKKLFDYKSVDLAGAPEHISEVLRQRKARPGFDVYLSFAEEDKQQAELLRNRLAHWGVTSSSNSFVSTYFIQIRD